MRPWSLVPLGLAVLEVVHPGFGLDSAGESISEAVRSASPWWLALHVLLVLGYAVLAFILWRLTTWPPARGAVAAFAACNTLYLAIDGIAVGVLAQTNPAGADSLWSAAWVNVLADATGAAWAASLLLIALSLGNRAAWQTRDGHGAQSMAVTANVGVSVTLVAFIASVLPVVGGPAVTALSRIAAVGTGAWIVYQRGASSIPVALLIFAAVLRQHVGAEAAFGLVLVAIATGRSVPGAASLP